MEELILKKSFSCKALFFEGYKVVIRLFPMLSWLRLAKVSTKFWIYHNGDCAQIKKPILNGLFYLAISKLIQASFQ